MTRKESPGKSKGRVLRTLRETLAGLSDKSQREPDHQLDNQQRALVYLSARSPR